MSTTVSAPRRLATDPLVPVLVLAAGGVALVAPPVWLVLGGLAGYTLSGSV